MSNHGHDPARVHAHGSTGQYVTGYLISLVLTIIPLLFVLTHSLSRTGLVVTIMVTAVLQFFVQLFLFMHIRQKQDGGPHWHGMGMVLGVVIALTIVGGSIWVMSFNEQVQ
ncbi:cytochrome o ubiquinol oxidase subunit IV [Tumebacillus flagellatus]|uniref:Heme transporter CcmD n=1 Tax=Tumebacillus flagellatus TaxID=1157490 RepID=A0A074LU98_9BACL|nr:cytochrome C oxidase subunit IV family protein [Tumebacillus flagellatus]KEO84135.1 heme transporter CcmD [Tumebacillus flagellatus]